VTKTTISANEVKALEARIKRKTQDKLFFRFGDTLYFREDTYEIGTAMVEEIIPLENEARLLSASCFSTTLQDKFCREGFEQLKSGDMFVYARARLQILALLDYRNPTDQKPIFLDESQPDAFLSVAQASVPYAENIENMLIFYAYSGTPVAIFRNPTILYHNTEL
jgi:hypothetical protein